MAAMEKSHSIIPDPAQPILIMAQEHPPPQQQPQVPPPQPQPAILVIFNQNNAIYANGQTTTPEGYVTYPDLPHIYGGGLRNGLPAGYGIQKNSMSGNTYEGGWKDGRAHGYGVFYWANGDRYEGGWKSGLQHGHGELTGTLAGTPTRVDALFKDGLKIST
jgi:hypothetical protein